MRGRAAELEAANATLERQLQNGTEDALTRLALVSTAQFNSVILRLIVTHESLLFYRGRSVRSWTNSLLGARLGVVAPHPVEGRHKVAPGFISLQGIPQE